MEHIVAVAVIDKKGTKYYFLTWGRIFDSVDDKEIISCVLKYARKCDVREPLVDAYLCYSLKDAASQTYFHEAFFYMAQKKVLFGKSYEKWRNKMAKALKKGNEIRYLGNPENVFKRDRLIRRKK